MALSNNIENYNLWKKFKEDNSIEARQQLIEEHLSLVKYQADRIKMLVPGFIEREDLEGFGIIGLIDALEKFDYQLGIKFTTYASKRIRGEIMDHLRKLDWLPHSRRQDGKRLKETVDSLAQTLGRMPTVEELSVELDMSVEKINSLYYQLYSSQWVSLYGKMGDGQILDILKADTAEQPENTYQEKQALDLLSNSIERLDESERLVITLYYYEELNQSEIATIMELSPARISQLHKRAIYRLRGFLARKKEQFV